MVALATAFVKLRPQVEDDEYKRAGKRGGKIYGDAAGKQLAKALHEALTGSAKGTGVAAGDEFAKAFSDRVKRETRDTSVGPDSARTRRQGEQSAGSFADGFRRQLQQASRALPPLEIGVAKNAAEQTIREVQAQLRALSDKTVGVDIDAGEAIFQVRSLQDQLRALASTSPDIQIQADVAATLAKLGRVTNEADRLDGRRVEVEVNADTDRASRGVSRLSSNITGGLAQAFSGTSGIASTFFQALSEGALKAGGQITTSVLSAASAQATMAAATGGLSVLISALAAVVIGATGGIVALGAAFLALAPAVSIVGGLLGALPGLLIGTVAAAAALKLGIGGVGAAFTAMVSAQEEAGKSSASFAGAQNAVAAASDQVKSALAAQANTRANIAEAATRAAQQIVAAERAVGQARAEAGRQAQEAQQRIGEAAQRVRAAQVSLTVAERDALSIRKELTRAQRDARESLEDLASRAQDNAISQRQALLDVADAQRERDKVLSDPKATEAQREQARIAFDRQYKQLTDLRREGQRLAADQAEANKKGIEGSDQVVQARKRIADADKGVVDARKGVKDAEDNVRKAQDAARQAQLSGNDRVGAAERALDDARAARDSQRRQSAYQLAQASQAVVSAQRSLRQASVQAGQAGGSALEELNRQMEDLSPNARSLVKTLFDLREPFGDLKKFVQDRLLDGVSGQVRTLAEKWLPALKTILGDMAGRLNGIGDGLFKAFGQKSFIDNVKVAAQGFGEMLTRIGKSLPGVIDAFGRIGAASTPVLKVIGDLIGGIFDKFSRFIKKADETGKLDSFMKDAAATLKQIFRIGGLVFTIIGQLIGILFPQSKKTSEGFLGGVEGFLKHLTDDLAKPENQQKIRDWVTKVGDFIEKARHWIERLADWINRVNDWVTKVSGWISKLSDWAKGIGDFFSDAGKKIGDAWTFLRDQVFSPIRVAVTQTIPDAFSKLRDMVGDRFGQLRDKVAGIYASVRDNTFGKLKTLVTDTIPNAFATARDRVSARFGEARDKVAGVWRDLRDNTFGKLKTLITDTIPGAFATARDRLAARFGEARDRIAGVWRDLRDNILGKLSSLVQTTIPNAFRSGVDAIKTAWDRLKNVAKLPVKFVVETVLNNGLIKGFNAVAGTFGIDDIKPIPLPKGFATGGVLPGYTPGRDVHRFASATGGTLDLSGGEAIMRPEWTRAVGTSEINAMNQAARSGGVAGVRRVMGFADGGIFGPGGKAFGELWKRVRGKASDVITGAKNIITNPAGAIKKLVGKLIGLIPDKTTPFGQLVTGAPQKLLDGAVNKLTGLIPGRSSGAGTSGPGNGKSPFGGSAGMMRALRAVFPGLPLISGYRPGARTLSGNPSYHGVDRAVDLPPIKAVAKFIHDAYGNITKELITPYQQYNLNNGRAHRYTGAIWNQHNFAGGNAHDHWAARLGGVMPRMKLFDTGGAWPTNTIGINTSGRTEYVDPNREGASMGDMVSRLDKVIDLLAGLGYDIVEAQRTGSRRTARAARAGGLR